jgi:phage terminase large subunit GpA-like protein
MRRVENTARKIEWFDEELMAWKPPPDLSITEWAEKYRHLSGRSAESGPFRIIRTPYLKPIMDVVKDPNVEKIVFIKSAQIAGTTAMENIVGYYAVEEKVPIIFVLADEQTCFFISEQRLKRMFMESPRLRSYYETGRFSKTEISLINGAHIEMAWSRSVEKLATREAPIVILDEIDKPGYYMTSREASPISLAEERTATFSNSKLLLLSTPTIETGNVMKEIESCDVVYDWHAPCPYCGVFQPLRWSRKYAWPFEDGKYRDESGEMQQLGEVKWEGGRNADDEEIEQAGYECGSCGEVWSTAQKNNAVEKGKMVARGDIGGKKIRKVGFHINRLYSLLGNSGNIPKLIAFLIPKNSRGS